MGRIMLESSYSGRPGFSFESNINQQFGYQSRELEVGRGITKKKKKCQQYLRKTKFSTKNTLETIDDQKYVGKALLNTKKLENMELLENE